MTKTLKENDETSVLNSKKSQLLFQNGALKKEIWAPRKFNLCCCIDSRFGTKNMGMYFGFKI